MLTELERTLAEHACAKLATDYAIYLDGRDFDGFVSLWSEDGVWHNTRGPLKGPEAIRQYVESQPTISLGRHVCTNIQITVGDAEHATGTSYFTFYNVADPGDSRPATLSAALFVGQYFDTYAKTGGGWKFSSRRMELTYKFG